MAEMKRLSDEQIKAEISPIWKSYPDAKSIAVLIVTIADAQFAADLKVHQDTIKSLFEELERKSRNWEATDLYIDPAGKFPYTVRTIELKETEYQQLKAKYGGK